MPKILLTAHGVTVDEAYRFGQQARRDGKPIWSNPHVGETGQGWRRGWLSAEHRDPAS